MKIFNLETLGKFTIFCVVGVLCAILDLSIFNILFSLEIHFSISRAIAVLSSLTFNFALNRNITFKAKKKSVIEQYRKHILVYSIALITNVVISSLVFWLLKEGTFNANIASIIGIISAIPISFLGSLLWTFKK
jgi:putative flippase GtrA